MNDLENENIPDLSLEISQKIQKMQLVYPIQSCWSSGAMGCREDERFETLPQRHVCIRKLSSIHGIIFLFSLQYISAKKSLDQNHCL